MIVKNEEDMLSRCLESVKHIVDEMIIVDTGSTDSTVKIAESFGAKVFYYKWDNSFSNARNFSMEKATKEWILIMDADDQFVKEDTNKLLNLINNKRNNTNAYFFETLCYSGDNPNSNIVMNLNIRLIKNGKDYKFVGNIHEQIMPGPEDMSRPDAMKNEKIRFYHYGYLNDVIKKKDKRNRNMNLIKKELEQNPNNPFMQFNMGNEFYALGKYSEALKYYMSSYDNINRLEPFISKLILRIVSCNEILNNVNDEFKFINLGLKHYPEFTDLQFLKANAFLRQGNNAQAISSLKKCIKMGEAPSNLQNITGVGSYRPYYVLSDIYFNLGEYDKAFECCDKVLKINFKFSDAANKMVRIMLQKKLTIDEIKLKFESYLQNNIDENSYFLLSDIFYDKNMFNIAFDYTEKAEMLSKDKSKAYYYKGTCKFYQRAFSEAYNYFAKVHNNEFLEKSICFSVLCSTLDNNIQVEDTLLDKYEKILTSKYYLVYIKFKELMKGNQCAPLAEDKETSTKFVEPIFSILNILLKTTYFDEFEKALQLLNLIENNDVLLLLAKLYFKYGFFKLAHKEFLRSIKLYEKIDVEGLEMMKQTIKY
jgi:glycosyltransferase involved in cell wall biosynthesis